MIAGQLAGSGTSLVRFDPGMRSRKRRNGRSTA
jgi:hypothetical protein